MNQRTYDLISSILFAIVAMVHLLRLVRGWQFTVAGAAVPMWVSILGLLVTGFLAMYGLRLTVQRT